MKSIYPGDSEFSLQNYHKLPYSYVILCVRNGIKEHKRRLHELERPTALLTSVFANTNRNPKSRKKPYDMTEFALYLSREDRNLPSGSYGAAALILANSGKFPTWALFCYKELVSGARQGYKPKIVAYMHEDAILLHPRHMQNGVMGFLIAKREASNRILTLKDEHGDEIRLQMPEINAEVVAEEDITLAQ